MSGNTKILSRSWATPSQTGTPLIPVAVENLSIQGPDPPASASSKPGRRKAPFRSLNETVVSVGRGTKGPENWGIVEDLATLGATTAARGPWPTPAGARTTNMSGKLASPSVQTSISQSVFRARSSTSRGSTTQKRSWSSTKTRKHRSSKQQITASSATCSSWPSHCGTQKIQGRQLK